MKCDIARLNFPEDFDFQWGEPNSPRIAAGGSSLPTIMTALRSARSRAYSTVRPMPPLRPAHEVPGAPLRRSGDPDVAGPPASARDHDFGSTYATVGRSGAFTYIAF